MFHLSHVWITVWYYKNKDSLPRKTSDNELHEIAITGPDGT